MAVVYTDIINMIIPVVLILVPTAVCYSYIPNRAGLVAGAVVGIALGTAGGVMESWVIVIAALLLASVVFMDNADKIPGVGGVT